MRAIEFVTIPKDGVIEIPKKYLTNLHQEVRVIILMNAEPGMPTTKGRKKRRFTALEITTRGFNFDRDEANKR